MAKAELVNYVTGNESWLSNGLWKVGRASRVQLLMSVKTLCSFFIVTQTVGGTLISYQNGGGNDPRTTNLSFPVFTLLHTHMYFNPTMSLLKVGNLLSEQITRYTWLALCEITNFHHPLSCLLFILLLKPKECKSIHNSANFCLHVTCLSIRSLGLVYYLLYLIIQLTLFLLTSSHTFSSSFSMDSLSDYFLPYEQ